MIALIRWSAALALIVTLLFSLPTCGPFGNNPSGNKQRQGPQYCFASFTQPASMQVNSQTAVSQPQVMPSYCVPQKNVTLEKASIVGLTTYQTPTSLSIEQFKQTFAVARAQPVIVVLDNCRGKATLQQEFRVTDTFQPGVLVASRYYTSAPTYPAGDFDAIASVLFSTYAVAIAQYSPTIFITPPIEAKVHTKTQLAIYWSEVYQGGLVTETQSGGTVIGNLAFAIPLASKVNTAKQDRSQPQSLPC
ncbi:MAG TPA: hypothetical protein VF725_12885 [Ktedonobacterales bacterium]